MPVPSPDKEGGFPGEASNLPGGKHIHAHRTKNAASDRTDYNYDDTARPRKIRVRKSKPLRIATWNVTSLLNKGQEVVIELKNHRVDVCALSETKKKGKGNLRMEDYILFYSGRPKNERATSGVGLLIHKKFEGNIKNTEYVNDRLLQTTFAFDSHERKTTQIICVYAPNIGKPQDEKNAFYDDLQ